MTVNWRSLVLVFFVLISGCVSSGSQSSTWTRTFEGPDYGAIFDLALTQDGGILAVGATNHLHFPPYSGDVLFIKLTLEGDVLWEQTWGGDGYEQAIAVEAVQDGGFYIFGETDSHGTGDRDFFLLKVNAEGDEEWFRTYGGDRREWPYGILRLSNGDLLIYGFTEPAGNVRDQYALRLGSDGDVIWEYTGDSPDEEFILDVLETQEGELILAVAAEEDCQLVKLDSSGNVEWTNRYELDGWQFASQIAEAEDDGFILAGFAMSTGSQRQADTWMAHASSSGELLWETSFGDEGYDDYATSMIRLKDGTYLLGAISDGFLLRNVDSEANVLWRRSLLDQSVYGSMALIELDQGGFLAGGFIQRVNGRSYDAILLRTDAEGRSAE
jgi:outer membrane protein assembly factor BamB